MIISASRRTDIPAFYSDWLINRLRAGYCLVKNPYNPARVRRVSLRREDVDGIVLWTKNAAPLLPQIAELERFPCYFQYSLTPYASDMERGLADKKDVIIPAFRALASLLGPKRVIWRYDPIVLTPRYDERYHIRAFTRLCGLLAGSTETCVISFVVPYKSVAKRLAETGYTEPDLQSKLRLAEVLLPIASEHGIALSACCEIPALHTPRLRPSSCVDAGMFGITAPRDKHQREGCGCAVSVDIGAYNSCVNGCLYCYANHNDALVRSHYAGHDPASELLTAD